MTDPSGILVLFSPISGERPGTVSRLLRESYAELLEQDSSWEFERSNWDQYDRDVFLCPDTVGACLFLTRLEGRIAGFGSWDPRKGPECGIIGHNCILPEFRGKGLGRLQIREIIRRFRELGMKRAVVSTNVLPFFAPARRMYEACGFLETRRGPSTSPPHRMCVEYEQVLNQSPKNR